MGAKIRIEIDPEPWERDERTLQVDMEEFEAFAEYIWPKYHHVAMIHLNKEVNKPINRFGKLSPKEIEDMPASLLDNLDLRSSFKEFVKHDMEIEAIRYIKLYELGNFGSECLKDLLEEFTNDNPQHTEEMKKLVKDVEVDDLVTQNLITLKNKDEEVKDNEESIFNQIYKDMD